MPTPRIALAHDWLCGFRGGEAVLERLAGLVDRHYSPAGLYTMFDDGEPLSPTVDAWRSRRLIHAWPTGTTRLGLDARRWLLPLYPRAVAHLGRELAREHARQPIDLVLSISSAAVKGLRPPHGVPHVCYCLSPARYVWGVAEEYAADRSLKGRVRSLGLATLGRRFKSWDHETAANVTRFVGISTAIQRRLRDCYERESDLVYPPVRTDYFTPAPAGTADLRPGEGRDDAPPQRERFWLVVSALEPYKRVDLAVAAARHAGVKLVVAGKGSLLESLRAQAGPQLEVLGRVPDGRLRELYRTAELLLFPQNEDFGIVAAEALACGCPVVARGEGGALDIVTAATGGLVKPCTSETLAAAALELRTRTIERDRCREAALRFEEQCFDAAMRTLIDETLAERCRGEAHSPL